MGYRRPQLGGVFRMRLTAKITVLIVVVLIIGFGAPRSSRSARERVARRAEQGVGAAAHRDGGGEHRGGHAQERPDITRGLIQDLKSSSPVEGLTIYRRNGVEAFTDLATLREVSKEAELPKGVVPPSRGCAASPAGP
jgi:hypothetical protein